MPTVIDGYNLYHAVMQADPQWESISRSALCREIAVFVGAGSDTSIIFDGSWPRERSAEETVRGVSVSFAGPGKEADAVIEDLILECSAPRRLVVVSTDRRLRKAAQRRGCTSIRSEAFAAAMLKRKLDPRVRVIREPVEKRRGLSDEQELRDWLTILGVDEPDPELPSDDLPWR